MRFVSLDVESFKGVKSAHVDFARGLNVLYGPNDLGKSTLAMAIRAALLLPTSSADADAFQPWFSDEKATVTLVFADDSERYWKVKKTFGGQAGAVLWSSKDGSSWAQDAKAREVDDKLRAILSWGIAGPASKGAPRGLPQSFLTNALLGEQDQVGAILSSGLEVDTAESGKVALTRALSALAQDPLLKKILDLAQHEVDRFFTEKGNRKRGQTSELALAGDAIKKLQTEHEGLLKQVSDAAAIEDRARALREGKLEAATRLDEAKVSLADTRARAELSRGRQQVARRLEDVRLELAKIDEHTTRVRTSTEQQAALGRSAEAARAALLAARAGKLAADEAVRQAEDTTRRIQSERGPSQLALERAQLESRRATLASERGRLEALAAKAQAGLRAQAGLTQASAALATAQGALRDRAGQLTEARAAQTTAEQDATLAEAIVAYGVWRTESERAKDATEARTQSKALTLEALSKDVEAQQLDTRARAALDEAEKRRAQLPSEAQREGLRRLAHEKEVAEASLGGGVNVLVRPRRAIALRTVADDGLPVDANASQTERTIEADRKVQLSIGDLVDLEITVGAREQRHAVDTLRRRWKEEVLPVLEQAGAASLADLDRLSAACAALAATAKDEAARATATRAAAQVLRDKAALLAQQRGPTREELDAKEARIGALPRDLLAQFFVNMGPTWDEQSNALRVSKVKALADARAALTALEGQQQQAEWNRQEAARREAEAQAALAAALEGLAGEAPAALQARVAKALADAARDAQQLEATAKALQSESSPALDAAKQALATAQANATKQLEAVSRAEAALASAEASLHAGQGELKALAAQLEALRRPEVAARLATVQRELDAFQNVQVSEAELDAAQARVDQAQAAHAELHDAFLQAEGALTSLAGPQVKERTAQLEEAIVVARARERELAVDSESWKLLRDALREAEDRENAHLGRLLGTPVAERFTELTHAKYGPVTLDQGLRTRAVALEGTQASGEDVLQALSVGTKDQLATLVRLAIARQLRSAILLDDQLVHTDVARLEWFATRLREVAADAQVLIFTCRPLDYLEPRALPTKDPVRDVMSVRVIDLARVVSAGR